MLLALEIFTAIFALMVSYQEIYRKRFHDFATSVFLCCFTPLMCIYPIVARLVVGGAYNITPPAEDIISNTYVYFIYQSCCLIVITGILISGNTNNYVKTDINWELKLRVSAFEIYTISFILLMGLYLYIASTGMSAIDLIQASRFEWFNNQNYSPFYFVISTYLISIAPLAILLCLLNPKYKYLAIFCLLILVIYGLMSKDRKWLIFVLSGYLAFIYVTNNKKIIVKQKYVYFAFISIIILGFWQIARGVLFDYFVNGVGDPFYDSLDLAARLLTRGDFQYYYNSSVTAIEMNFVYGVDIPFGLVRRQAFFFLPVDYSLGLKIEDISAIFSDIINAGDSLRRGNMPPGFFGLFILSFQWYGGILSLIAIPVFLRFLDRLIIRNKGLFSIALTSQFLSSTLLLLRGDDSSATYYIFFTFFVLLAIRPPLQGNKQSHYITR